MQKWIKKAKDYTIPTAIIVILSFEITTIRTIFKAFFLWFQNMIHFPSLVNHIALFRPKAEYICIASIVLCLIIDAIQNLKAFLADRKTKKAKGDNPFETSILRYLNTIDSPKCYLISGPWGSGKSYMLNNFLKKHYSCSHRNIYKVSCFGLNTREALIDEINNVIKKSDHSYHNHLTSMIKILPVVGEPLSTLLTKTYSFRSQKAQSIFVFDDFERLSMHPFNDNPPQQHISNLYTATSSNQYAALATKIDTISESLLTIQYSINNFMLKANSDKYLVIVGIINEMIEVYGYKVIIVCNTDILDKQLFYSVLKTKLNYIEYVKRVSIKSAEQLSMQIVSNLILDDDSKLTLIKDFLKSTDSYAILKHLHTNNLRFFGTIIEAFVITAIMFDTAELCDDRFMISLLASILVVQHYKDTGNIKFLQNKPNGINIRFLTQNTYLIDNCRWIDYKISGYYLLNLPSPSIIHETYSEWINYPYISLEIELISDNFTALNDYDFDVIHFAYLVNKLYSQSGYTTIDLNLYINKLLDKWHVYSENELAEFFSAISKNLTFSTSQFEASLFKTISIKTNNMKSSGNDSLSLNYNNYLISDSINQ